MDSIVELYEQLPQPIKWAIIGFGAFALASKVLGIGRFFLDVFVRRGTNVSAATPLLSSSLQSNC